MQHYHIISSQLIRLAIIFNMSHRWHDVYQDELEYFNSWLANPKKVNREQDTIFPRQAVTRITKELDLLRGDYQFSFEFVKPEEFQDDQTVRSVRRLIKLRFRCKNQTCPQYKQRRRGNQKSSDVQRNWTSYNGVVDFKFSLNVDSNEPKILFTFSLYSQKCLTCLKWGKSGLIDSCLETLISLYSLLIQNSLVCIRENRQIRWNSSEKFGAKLLPPSGNYTSHISRLCEACILEVCPRFYKEKQEYYGKIKKEEDEPKQKKKYLPKTEVKVEEENSQFIIASKKYKNK